MARLIGNAIFKICRLLISTCKLLCAAVIAIEVGSASGLKISRSVHKEYADLPVGRQGIFAKTLCEPSVLCVKLRNS